MIRMILTLLLIYIVYKFVFEFLILLFNTTRHMSNKVKEMTEKMQEQERKKQMEEQNHTAHRREYCDLNLLMDDLRWPQLP